MPLDHIVNQLQYVSVYERFNGTTNSFQVIVRQQLGVVTFIVFAVRSKCKAKLEDSALHGAEKSVVQPVLPRSITSSIRMARRKTWPEGVAERRGRKAWSESVAERRDRKTCLLESQDFFKW